MTKEDVTTVFGVSVEMTLTVNEWLVVIAGLLTTIDSAHQQYGEDIGSLSELVPLAERLEDALAAKVKELLRG